MIAGGFMTGHLGFAFVLGIVMSYGHLAGHAGNHWSLSSMNWFNRSVSVLCTGLWGLREKNWEFSHLISHHCYCYTEKDYIAEQHVPYAYFRIKDTDTWKPIHAYQHLLYLTTPFTSFFLGGLRLDCAPFIFVSPLLGFVRYNRDSPLPAPQFFAPGSNCEEGKLPKDSDGVGPDNFTVFDTDLDTYKSIFLANIVFLPMFLSNWKNYGLFHAILWNFCAFGTQAAWIAKSLLTQHLCEDIILASEYEAGDCWYQRQMEASVTVKNSSFVMWVTYAISFQIEHHLFPCLGPELLLEVQQDCELTAKEFNVQYNLLKSGGEAYTSVYNHFKKLSVKPVAK
jgi:fatty acid desaturase